MKKVNIRLKQTKQVKEYNKSLKAGLDNRHIVKKENGWAIVKPGKRRASRILPTQKEAIQKAESMNSRKGSKIVVHGIDGQIKAVH